MASRCWLKEAVESDDWIDEVLSGYILRKQEIENSELANAIKSAKSVEEILQELRRIDESHLEMECFAVAIRLFELNAFEQVIDFGGKAFFALLGNYDYDRITRLLIVDLRILIGAAYFKLGNYKSSLLSLEKANSDLRSILRSGSFNWNANSLHVLAIFVEIEKDLYDLKCTIEGYTQEPVTHALNILEIQQNMFTGRPCVELVASHNRVSDAYLRLFDYKAALPYCWKSLEIYEMVYLTGSPVETTLEEFRAVVDVLDESKLAMECYVVAERLFKLNAFEQVIDFGNKALTDFTDNDDNSITSRLRIVDALSLLAKSCYNLEMYDQSLGYLDQVNTDLTQLLLSNANVVGPFIDAQMRLYIVKHKMGNRDEAVVHVLRILDIKEKMLSKGVAELGDTYTIVFEDYLRVFDHRAALPFCLKALEIYEAVHGLESLEVAETWRKLAVIHHARREYKESLDFNMLAVSGLQNTNPDSSDLLSAEVEGASTMIELGKYQEAVDTLKRVDTRVGTEGWLKVKWLLTMATALCCLRKVTEAEMYIKKARSMLFKKEIDPVLVSIGYLDLSLVYKKKNDLEKATTMMKNALESSKLPQKLLLTLYAAFMSLISKPAKLSEEVSYLEGELEKLKTRFGIAHCVVGYGYANLGVAYFGSRQKEIGVKSFENAKAILDDTLGSHHLDSLKISHCLSLAFATQGRYKKAMEVEDRVTEVLQRRVQQSEDKFLERATRHLNNMKERVREFSTRASSS